MPAGCQIGFIELIKQIDSAWKNRRDEINSNAEQITNYLRDYNSTKQKGEININIFEKAFKSFEERYDKIYGGFGNSPKFPSPHNLMFLLRYWKRTGTNSALAMVEKTLTQMRMGGVFDQIGFGFHRYSTDKEWLLPHFEKMLYDQALISSALVETYQATKNEYYKKIAKEIFEYILRDMTSQNGGFYSAEDADSEGEEGKFYVWNEEEINTLLKENAVLFKKIFNVSVNGNFTEESTRTPTGTNILHMQKTLQDYSNELKISLENLVKIINESRKILFQEREKRIHPLKDDKILTDWNGLMIASLAKAGKVFENKVYIETAEKSVKFIFNKLVTKDGKLLHRFREGEAAINANADDYAFLIYGLIELYEATFKIEYLENAIILNKIFIKHFYDEANGAFFFTSDESEKLIVRTKEIYDGAIPSANSVALLNLLKLSRITADNKYEKLAEEITKTFSDEVSKQPTAYSQFLCGLDFTFGPSQEIIIAEGSNKNETEPILKTINNIFIPNKIVLFIPRNNPEKIYNIAGYTSSYIPINNKTTVYICKNYECSLPQIEHEEILKLLNA